LGVLPNFFAQTTFPASPAQAFVNAGDEGRHGYTLRVGNVAQRFPKLRLKGHAGGILRKDNRAFDGRFCQGIPLDANVGALVASGGYWRSRSRIEWN